MMEGKANNKYSYLPAGWEMKRLKDVAINCGDYGANAPALPYKAGDIRYIRITDIDDYGHLISDDQASLDETIAQNYLLKDNDILFARTGDTVGKSLLYKSSMGRAAYAGYLIRFTLDEKLILPEYFDAIAKSDIFEAFKISMKRIGAKPNINSREYGIFRFPMPLNLDEQKGIAKLFTKVDKAIASVQNSIAAAERLKKSLMQNLLTGKMKPDGTFRTPEEFYIDKKFGKVPMGWKVVKFGKRVVLLYGKSQKEVVSKNGSIPIYGTGGVIEYATKALCNHKSVLVGRKGTIDKPFFIDVPFWAVDTTFFVDTFNDGNMKYLYYLLLRMNLRSLNEATGVPSVTIRTINSQIIIIPPLNEQNIIVQEIEKVEKQITKSQNNIATLERLKKSLMQNLLTGKVKINAYKQ